MCIEKLPDNLSGDNFEVMPPAILIAIAVDWASDNYSFDGESST
jgi:hypothetical protein